MRWLILICVLLLSSCTTTETILGGALVIGVVGSSIAVQTPHKQMYPDAYYRAHRYRYIGRYEYRRDCR